MKTFVLIGLTVALVACYVNAMEVSQEDLDHIDKLLAVHDPEEHKPERKEFLELLKTYMENDMVLSEKEREGLMKKYGAAYAYILEDDEDDTVPATREEVEELADVFL